jgi:heme/copper-type cytochrome/quinol oxidase subunit 3
MNNSASLPLRHKKVLSDGVMGMIFLVTTEVMFFAGLISAYIVNRAGSAVWPPAGQPRLPVAVTALNTMVLFGSAIMLYIFKKGYRQKAGSMNALFMAVLLGALFVAVQGTEWVRLISFGLTTTSSLYGAFFYVLIGAHALHVLAGLCVLWYLYAATRRSATVEDARNTITAGSIYWYFVVGIWPVLYILVYLI